MLLIGGEFGGNTEDALTLTFVLFTCVQLTCSCGPGRGYGGGQRQRPSLVIPLVFKQHIPNTAEEMLGASGSADGRIERADDRFKALVKVTGDDVIFKDEEGTGDDRYMTTRCRDRLLKLAVVVSNRWPGVKVRVIEGWDGGGLRHPKGSLHYEGRAIDITTSDKDRSKYGLLARMAVEAGFDWVFYESRGHVHCSVKSDSSIATKFDGCFSRQGHVKVEGFSRPIPMSKVKVGDRVLTADGATGTLRYDDVIAFLHRDENASAIFLRLVTTDDVIIDVTPSHLLFSSPTSSASLDQATAVRASDVTRGMYVFVSNDNDSSVRPAEVRHVSVIRDVGVYAPLTRSGTIVVDGVVASCYAVIRSHDVAHLSMTPLRVMYDARRMMRGREAEDEDLNVMHWYPELLLKTARQFAPALLE